MKVNLRVEESGKREEIFPLLAKCFPEYWAPLVALGKTYFSFPLVSVIAECDGIVTGHCGIYIFELYLNGKLQKAAGLCAVAVDPDCRGMGIAGKMCDTVLDYCHGKNIFFSPLYTGVPKVYEKRGWKLYKLSAPQRTSATNKNLSSYKNKLNEKEQNAVRELYSNGFIFDGKIKRSELKWNTLFSNKDFLWYLTENAYALVLKDGENYILCEAYAKNDCWNELSRDGLLLSLPATHPLLKKQNLEDSPIDIWHKEVAMVNIINTKPAFLAGLVKAIEENTFFFPLPDKF